MALIVYAWKNRTVHGARYFLYTLILIAFWIITQALELSALELETKIFWANLQYIPVMLTPVTFLFLSLQFTRHEHFLLQRRWVAVVLILIPVALNILLWTNAVHGLVRQNVYLDTSGAFPVVAKTFGPIFWVFAVYNFSVAFLTLLILAQALQEKISLYREQVQFLFIGLLVPVMSLAIHVTGLNPFPMDTTPAVFGVMGLITSWGIFRYRLFDIVPFARSLVIQEMKTGMLVVDNLGRIVDINPAAKKALNVPLDQIHGLPCQSVLPCWPEMFRAYRKEGIETRELHVNNDGLDNCYELSLTKLSDSSDKIMGWLIQIYNITERKTAEEKTIHAALHDHLTGLPNRTYFQRLFAQELAQARSRGHSLTVGYLDFDDFKLINDTHGHSVGDFVLSIAAEKLQGTLRKSDIIARLGGDEFALLLPYLENNEQIEAVGNKIIKALGEKVVFQGLELEIRASLGFSVFPRDGDDGEQLLKKADRAMYKVKENTKNSYCIYSPEN